MPCALHLPSVPQDVAPWSVHVVTQQMPPAQWPHDPSLKPYPYDPAKAKQLLTEAGFPNGFKTELLAYSSPRGYNPAGPELAVAVQGYLQKVGVEATIRKQEMGAFLAEVRSGKYQSMFMAGFSGDNGDPDNFLYTLFDPRMMPTNDTSHYNNPEVDKMLVDAKRLSDPAKRIELYKKAQAAIQGDLVRVSSRDRDTLQEIIALLRGKDFGIDMQFTNYRTN